MATDEADAELEVLKKQIKKLSAQAIDRKMKLHDLAEDLPIGWETIPTVAAAAYEAYQNLILARAKLAESGGAYG
ncbi:MAG TPA: CCE_0567 family metalloprotein [Acidiferrobacter sp.]|nr:CCE_0567 family metalloprotein [Acidiferrobacter sp.]